MKKREFDYSSLDSPSSEHQTKKVEMKQLRIGLEAHLYLKNEAFKREISMKTLVDEIVLEYRDHHH